MAFVNNLKILWCVWWGNFVSVIQELKAKAIWSRCVKFVVIWFALMLGSVNYRFSGFGVDVANRANDNL